MRTTVTIDDTLLEKAVKWSGIEEKSRLVNFVLQEYVHREAGRRLAAMGGTMPELEVTPRGPRAGREPLGEGGDLRVAEDPE